MGVARSHVGGYGGMPPQRFSILDALRVNLAHLETQKGHHQIALMTQNHAHLPTHFSIPGDAGLAIMSWNKL